MEKAIDPEERAAVLALNTLFGFTPRKGQALMQHFEKPSQIFHLTRDEFMQIGLKETNLISQLNPSRLERACQELADLEKHNTRFITMRDECYPKLLLECKDAPIGLYLKSEDLPEHIFNTSRIPLAIVGTRDISPYGSEVCTKLVRTLAGLRPKPLIVSGLALGVDITAHRTALENGMPTLAVMATGTDRVYPFSHGWAAEEICKTPGSGLISDYPLGTQPQALNFIRRNRIMAGMSIATILIESKIRGGGLVTARLASSYDREVYAVPGRIKDSRSQGCNLLIRKNTAIALTDYDQIIEDLGMNLQTPAYQANLQEKVRKRYSSSVSKEEMDRLIQIVKTIEEETEINLETLASVCGLEYKETLYLTSLLESDGFITTDLLHNCSIDKDFV